jgi:hypothetical protein
MHQVVKHYLPEHFGAFRQPCKALAFLFLNHGEQMAHRVRTLSEGLIEQYRQLLDYEPSTGALTWKSFRGGGAPATGTQAGTKTVYGYIAIRVRALGQARPAHRIAWALTHGRWPVQFIDHINGNRSDNRLCNLREADQTINSQNTRTARSTNKTTGLLGAHLHKASGRYAASIGVNRKTKHLGLFDTAQQAHAAYISAKRQLHEGGVL